MPSYVFLEEAYDDEYLLNLTGIRALHPKGEENLNFTYKIIPDEFTDELLVVKIQSEYFSIFNVQIDVKFKKIENLQIISTKVKPRVSQICLKRQVEFAIAEKYTHINIIAAKVLSQQQQLIGYRVFGRHGYLMRNVDDEYDFRLLMREASSDFNYEALNEIYESNEGCIIAQKVWRDGGFRWGGKFILDKDALSYKILQRCES